MIVNIFLLYGTWQTKGKVNQTQNPTEIAKTNVMTPFNLLFGTTFS